MSCAVRRHHSGRRARVLCFECYRSRIDRSEPVKVRASPFPRVLTEHELAHRRLMLAHLVQSSEQGASRPQSRDGCVR